MNIKEYFKNYFTINKKRMLIKFVILLFVPVTLFWMAVGIHIYSLIKHYKEPHSAIIKPNDTIDIIHGNGVVSMAPDTFNNYRGVVYIDRYYNNNNWKIILVEHSQYDSFLEGCLYNPDTGELKLLPGGDIKKKK